MQPPPSPAAFRAALLRVAPRERDAWVDAVLGIDEIPSDGPALPRGCTPYLPCAVQSLLHVVDAAHVSASDVFVDVGAGIGRAGALVHLLTGASVIGLEVQPELVRQARALTERVPGLRLSAVEGDAADLVGQIRAGSIFFFYCPFSGARLDRVLDDLAELAREKELRIGCVDMPLPPRPWLELTAMPATDVAIYRSVQR